MRGTKLRPVRGTHDLLPDEARGQRHVVDTAREWAARYGFDEIATPIFEFSEVFQRTLGETSDVVTKEMYTFTDRGARGSPCGRSTRPALCVPLYPGGLTAQRPLKLFASGPMFRYERPQKGRLRQFHQIDVESLGSVEPAADVEAIALAADVLDALGVRDSTVLELNTLGDQESRAVYRERLVAFLRGREGDLSHDSQARLDRNPLRVLDSKDAGDREVVRDAPRIADSLSADVTAFFAEVRSGLQRLGIAFDVNHRLVRGLDYYTHTAFEFTTAALGAQGAVIAGGRYDGLVEAMGGPPTPGIGWAGGVERLAMLAAGPPPPPRLIALVPMGAPADARAPSLAGELRRAGFRVDCGFSGNLKKRMQRADKTGARAAVLIGEDELARDVATVRDLDSGVQSEVALPDLPNALARLYG